jgi:hypothetical protein
LSQMRKMQIRLSEGLYKRAVEFAREHHVSLGEVARRSLDSYLDQDSGASRRERRGRLPEVDGGGPVGISVQKVKRILDRETAKLP